MESIDNSGTVMGNGVHTYATINQVNNEPSVTASITSEFSSNSGDRDAAMASSGAVPVVNGNGHLQQSTKQPTVAAYEQPIFSQSQHESTFIVSHYQLYYDTMGHLY